MALNHVASVRIRPGELVLSWCSGQACGPLKPETSVRIRATVSLPMRDGSPDPMNQLGEEGDPSLPQWLTRVAVFCGASHAARDERVKRRGSRARLASARQARSALACAPSQGPETAKVGSTCSLAAPPSWLLPSSAHPSSAGSRDHAQPSGGFKQAGVHALVGRVAGALVPPCKHNRTQVRRRSGEERKEGGRPSQVVEAQPQRARRAATVLRRGDLAVQL